MTGTVGSRWQGQTSSTNRTPVSGNLGPYGFTPVGLGKETSKRDSLSLESRIVHTESRSIVPFASGDLRPCVSSRTPPQLSISVTQTPGRQRGCRGWSRRNPGSLKDTLGVSRGSLTDKDSWFNQEYFIYKYRRKVSPLYLQIPPIFWTSSCTSIKYKLQTVRGLDTGNVYPRPRWYQVSLFQSHLIHKGSVGRDSTTDGVVLLRILQRFWPFHDWSAQEWRIRREDQVKSTLLHTFPGP